MIYHTNSPEETEAIGQLLAARLKLADSVRSVISNCLALLGVAAPTKM